MAAAWKSGIDGRSVRGLKGVLQGVGMPKGTKIRRNAPNFAEGFPLERHLALIGV
jgi:hypothetical protein